MRRTLVRLAAGLIAAAVPLAAAGGAQAAIGTANIAKTTVLPDVIGASLVSSNQVRYCFDKTVASVPNPGGFFVSGYRSDSFIGSSDASVGPAQAGCAGTVLATFASAQTSGSVDNINHMTIAQVAEGAVRTTGNFANRADSVPLSGASSGDGTRGLTTAPDLQGTSVVSGGTQQIAFTFDQNVNPSAIVGNGGFHFVTASGTDVSSNGAAVSTTDPKTVIAQFPVGGGTPLVTTAIREYILPGAVQSQTAEHTPGTWDSQATPGSSGQLNQIPTLVAAVYSRQQGGQTVPPAQGGSAPSKTFDCGTTGRTDCVVVDYTFTEGVSVNQAATSQFWAYLSDGSWVHPTAVSEPSGTRSDTALTPNAPTYTGSTTVRAWFTDSSGTSNTNQDAASGFDEYLVKAGVSGTTTTGGNTSAAPSGTTPFQNGTGASSGCSTTANGGAFNQQTAGCAVVSTSSGHPNSPGSAPIGGNNGGSSIGYTTAPDALRVTFDRPTNTASVLFDSRVFNPFNNGSVSDQNMASMYWLDSANGNPIQTAVSISSCPPSTTGYPCPLPKSGEDTASYAPALTPAPTVVYLQFQSPAAQVGNAAALEIRGQIGGDNPFAAFTGVYAAFGGNTNNCGSNSGYGNTQGSTAPPSCAPSNADPSGNVQQIVAPAAVAANAHLRASRHFSHRRMTAAYLRSVLKRTQHHNKRHNKRHSR